MRYGWVIPLTVAFLLIAVALASAGIVAANALASMGW